MQNYVVVSVRPDGSLLLHYVRAFGPQEARDNVLASVGVVQIRGVWLNTPANAQKYRVVA